MPEKTQSSDEAIDFLLLSPSYQKDMNSNDRKRKTLAIREYVISKSEKGYLLSRPEKDAILKELESNKTDCALTTVDAVLRLYVKTKKALQGDSKTLEYFRELDPKLNWVKIPYEFLVKDGIDTWEKAVSAWKNLQGKSVPAEKTADKEPMPVQDSDLGTDLAENVTADSAGPLGTSSEDDGAITETDQIAVSRPMSTLDEALGLMARLKLELGRLEGSKIELLKKDMVITKLRDRITGLEDESADQKARLATLIDQINDCCEREDRTRARISQLVLDTAQKDKELNEAREQLRQKIKDEEAREEYFNQLVADNNELMCYKQVFERSLQGADLGQIKGNLPQMPERKAPQVIVQAKVNGSEKGFSDSFKHNLPNYSAFFKARVRYEQPQTDDFLDGLLKTNLKKIKKRIVNSIMKVCRSGSGNNLLQAEVLKDEDNSLKAGPITISPAEGYVISYRKDKGVLYFFSLKKK